MLSTSEKHIPFVVGWVTTRMSNNTYFCITQNRRQHKAQPLLLSKPWCRTWEKGSENYHVQLSWPEGPASSLSRANRYTLQPTQTHAQHQGTSGRSCQKDPALFKETSHLSLTYTLVVFVISGFLIPLVSCPEREVKHILFVPSL